MNISQAQQIAKNELFKAYTHNIMSVRTSITLTKEVFDALNNSFCDIFYKRNSCGELVVPTFMGAVVFIQK